MSLLRSSPRGWGRKGTPAEMKAAGDSKRERVEKLPLPKMRGTDIDAGSEFDVEADAPENSRDVPQNAATKFPPRVSRSQTRKAQKRIAELKARDNLTDWEQEFLESLEARLETFGSAFADPAKGRPDRALSRLQAQKVQQISEDRSPEAAAVSPATDQTAPTPPGPRIRPRRPGGQRGK